MGGEKKYINIFGCFTEPFNCKKYPKSSQRTSITIFALYIIAKFGRLRCEQLSASHTLDIAHLRESSPSPQKRTGMARVLKQSHSFTCTPTRSSVIWTSHTCLCLPSYSWYSFTDPGGMEGWVGLGDWLRCK